jgi:toxin ParE1/3/4
MKLRYERGALADLDEIFAYVAADNREAAGRLLSRIEYAAGRIAASPHIGGATRKSGFLRFPVGKYLIVYEIGNDAVVPRRSCETLWSVGCTPRTIRITMV